MQGRADARAAELTHMKFGSVTLSGNTFRLQAGRIVTHLMKIDWAAVQKPGDRSTSYVSLQTARTVAWGPSFLKRNFCIKKGKPEAERSRVLK